MPNPFKVLSTLSYVIGAIGAAAVLGLLYPVPSNYVVPLGLAGFLVAGLICEAVVRLRGKGKRTKPEA